MIKSFTLCLLFLMVGISYGGEKVSIYQAADNSGKMLKIVENQNGLDEIYFGEERKELLKMTIVYADIVQEYVKIKSPKSKLVFELQIDWKHGKVVVSDADSKNVTYWLINA